jgi:hypothetical protein
MSLKFLKCDRCNEVFDEGEAGFIEDHMGVTDPYPVYVRFQACPECESTDLEDFARCDTDDCENEAVTGHDYCAECVEKLHE